MKKIKVFESGNYPQGNFNKERVKAVWIEIKNYTLKIYFLFLFYSFFWQIIKNNILFK